MYDKERNEHIHERKSCSMCWNVSERNVHRDTYFCSGTIHSRSRETHFKLPEHKLVNGFMTLDNRLKYRTVLLAEPTDSALPYDKQHAHRFCALFARLGFCFENYHHPAVATTTPLQPHYLVKRVATTICRAMTYVCGERCVFLVYVERSRYVLCCKGIVLCIFIQ